MGSPDRERVFERMIACLGHMSTDTREACIQEMIDSDEAVRRGLGYRFRDRINGSESPLPFGYDEPVECAVCGQFECEHLGNITVSQVRPRGEGDPPPYEVNFSAGVGRSNLTEGYRLPGGERVDAPTESDVEVNELLRSGGEANSTRVFDITCTECGSISTLCLVGTVSVNGIGCTCGCTSMTVRLRQVDDIVH